MSQESNADGVESSGGWRRPFAAGRSRRLSTVTVGDDSLNKDHRLWKSFVHSRLKPLPQTFHSHRLSPTNHLLSQTFYCHCGRPLAERGSQAIEILRPFAAEAAPTDFLLAQTIYWHCGRRLAKRVSRAMDNFRSGRLTTPTPKKKAGTLLRPFCPALV